jgi:Glutaminase
MLSKMYPSDDLSALKEYKISVINKAFDHLSNKAEIDYEYLQGGCQQRSHLASLILRNKLNIEHGKVWLFAPAALYNFDYRALLVEDTNKLTKDKVISWNFHTAPVIKLKNEDGSVTLMVLDPSINKHEALPLELWLDCIGNSRLGEYTFTTPEKYFFNCKYNEYMQLTNIFDGTFSEFVNPAKDNLILEKGLSINDTAMMVFRKYIKPIMDNPSKKNLHKLNDLKEIFGDAMVLDLLFCQSTSGYTDSTTYRYLVSEYPEISKEAFKYFHKRLIFWTLKTTKLLK